METALDRLTEQTRVALAVGFIRDADEDTLASQIELSEIPAPPFEEQLRASRMAELMSEAGLEDVKPILSGTSSATGRGRAMAAP